MKREDVKNGDVQKGQHKPFKGEVECTVGSKQPSRPYQRVRSRGKAASRQTARMSIILLILRHLPFEETIFELSVDSTGQMCRILRAFKNNTSLYGEEPGQGSCGSNYLFKKIDVFSSSIFLYLCKVW